VSHEYEAHGAGTTGAVDAGAGAAVVVVVVDVDGEPCSAAPVFVVPPLA